MYFTAFDVETTGIEPGSRIIEIAAVKVEISSGLVVERFCELVNPQMPLPADAQAVNRIDAGQIAGAKRCGPVLDRWLGFIAGSTFLAAHFAPYDVGVISWELDRWSLPLPDLQVVDTCELAKAIKATVNNKLTTLVEHYKIKTSGDAHRALADAEACAEYYKIAAPLSRPIMRTWMPDHRYVKPQDLPAHLSELPGLIEYGVPFSFGYTDQQGVHTDRRIVPYGWSLVKGALMVHGLCMDRNERRTFRADRMDGAK